MIKNKSTISINILSVLIILMSVFIAVVGSTNSWFTSKQENGVQIIINVGDLKLNLYQKTKDEETQQVTTKEIYTYEQNTTDKTNKYIELSGPVIPGEDVALNLCLENKDIKSVPMYVRFKFELYLRDKTKDIKIPVLLKVDGETGDASFGQKDNASINDYYYYQDSGKNNVLFEKEASVDLMTHFKIDYDEMLKANGDINYFSSEAMYIKLTIEATLINW